MGHMKRLLEENPHGICESYIDSQETAMNTAKDQIRELEKLIGELVDLVDIDHYQCDLYSDKKCYVLGDGEWQIRYQHGLIRKAKQAIEESEISNA